jgi:hypothetical protein
MYYKVRAILAKYSQNWVIIKIHHPVGDLGTCRRISSYFLAIADNRRHDLLRV